MGRSGAVGQEGGRVKGRREAELAGVLFIRQLQSFSCHLFLNPLVGAEVHVKCSLRGQLGQRLLTQVRSQVAFSSRTQSSLLLLLSRVPLLR